MKLSPRVVFEDEDLLVLDKPAGMVVNDCETTRDETVQKWLENYLKITGLGIGDRAGIVHRLDKETSGLLVVGKTQKAFADLQNQFKTRLIKKKYLALVHGRVVPSDGVIKAAIARSPFDRKKFGVFLGGREAETEYKTLRHYDTKKESYTLVEIIPKTGRTHQIRVHFKYLGYPLCGDEKYAGRKTARNDRLICPRHFLHASYLSFTHPEKRSTLEFSSPLPRDLEKALAVLH